MSIVSKLYIDNTEFNILRYHWSFHQNADTTGRPSAKPMGGIISIVLEATKNAMLTEWTVDATAMKHLKIVQSSVKMNGKSRVLEFYDAICLQAKDNFDGVNNQPMQTTITVSSPLIVVNGVKIMEKYWKVSDLDTNSNKTTINQEITPTIAKIDWIHPETKEKLEETTYTQNIALTAKVNNPSGNAVNITITKKDGTEFEEGKKELVFSETLNEEDGTVEITTLEIEEQWEAFKEADKDELVAKVTHSGVAKNSNPLPVTPTPKVLVNFRPNDSWKGEFGFDWIRKDDTGLFKDEKFEDIISKQYTDSSFTTLERSTNEFRGKFKKDTTQFKKLKEKYKPFEIDWRQITDASGNKVNDKHCTEWLSLKKGKEAKVKIHIEVTEKADYLQFDDNGNFTITPNKIDIKNKTGTKKLNDIITIKCNNEFTTDQEIIVKAYKENQEQGKLAGKLNVWANDATKQKQKKVVFVQIKTPPISSRFELESNASNEKTRINKYLEQAYIQLHPDSKIEDLDLTTDPDFSRFVHNGKILKESKLVPAVPATATVPAKPAILPEKLNEYLKKKLTAVDAKYATTDFFKAFYFAENGFSPRGNLSGFSKPRADFVVVFASANDQTASHEFLHSFKLPHTFTNSEASANVEFTYQAKMTDNLLDYSHNISGDRNNNKRCSLYYWQWVKANNSI